MSTPQYQPDEHPPYRHQNTYPQFSSPEEAPHGLDSSPIPFSLDHSKDPRQPPKSHSQPAEQFSRPPESRRRNSTTGYGRRRNANEGPSTPKLPRARKMTFQNLNLQNLTVPPRKLAADPPLITQLKSILFGNWFKLLLLTIPVAWALHFTKPDEHKLVFIFSFVAIMPLAQLLGYATEELSYRVGETVAGLMNATLGNAVELIVAILALRKCELRIVQSSLVGSILSNLLLVLGMCFFAGGFKYSEQGFAVGAVQVNSSLLTLSVIALLIPAAFDRVTSGGQTSLDSTTEQRDILTLSHGTAIILLIIYASYLIFQLFSHKSLYDDETGAKPVTVLYPNGASPADMLRLHRRHKADVENVNRDDSSHESDVQHPELSWAVAIALLLVVTVFVGVTAEFLVDSIGGLADEGGISKEFIGLILLPIASNAAEHFTAVMVSVKDKLTLSLSVAVGSSIQIALFVIPFIVVLGWAMNKPVTMLFDPFESIVLFLAVLTVNYVVQDGKSNWLEGMILMCLYAIVALVFWYYPGTQLTGLLNCSA